jgi:hypothetical protein
MRSHASWLCKNLIRRRQRDENTTRPSELSRGQLDPRPKGSLPSDEESATTTLGALLRGSRRPYL